MDNLNESIMRWTLWRLNNVPDDDTVAGCEAALTKAMADHSPESDDDTPGVCDACNRVSWVSLSPLCCPFCGVAEVDADALEAATQARAHERVNKNKGSDMAQTKTAAVVKEQARAAKARADIAKEKEKVDKEKAKEKAKAEKEKAKEKADKEKAKEKEKAKAEKMRAAAAHASTVVVASVQLTSEELQRAVDKAKAFQAQAMGGYWDLAETMRDINENKTYLLEVDSAGSPVYSKWADFCSAVFGFSRRYADNLIQICKLYTRSQIETIGVSKLSLIAGASKEDQPALTALAAKGATRATLREAKTQQPSAPLPTPKESRLIVVMLEARRWEVPLYTRHHIGELVARAESLTEFPHGETITANGMRLLFWVKRDDENGLVVEVEVQRVDKVDD